MNTIENKEKEYSLHNIKNYNKILCEDIQEVLVILTELFINYYIFSIENIKLKNKNNNNLIKFITLRGLETVIHVFNFVLLYTNNLNLTHFHCQKSYYYYIEFINQIIEDDKILLRLSSRDATMYVYNKTICEIEKMKKKTNDPLPFAIEQTNNNKLNIINLYANIYKKMLTYLINNSVKDYDKINDMLCVFNKLNKLSKEIIELDICLINANIEKSYCETNNLTDFVDACIVIMKDTHK